RACLLAGFDEADLDRPAAPDQLRRGRAPPPAPAWARLPDDDLARVALARIAQERVGDVGARQRHRLGAEPLREPQRARHALTLPRGSLVEARRLDEGGDPLHAAPLRGAPPRAHERLRARARVDADEHALRDRPHARPTLRAQMGLHLLVYV